MVGKPFLMKCPLCHIWSAWTPCMLGIPMLANAVTLARGTPNAMARSCHRGMILMIPPRATSDGILSACDEVSTHSLEHSLIYV